MKKLIVLLALSLPLFAQAASEEVHLDKAPLDLHNERSLQRGAKDFVNYCMGCHGMKFLRWNRMAADLGLSDEQLKENLLPPGANPGSVMTSAMDPANAKQWFGGAVPDLTLTARARGSDWIYTYLRSFYSDPKRALGVNNATLPGASMPHVLQPLQGLLELVEPEHGEEGHAAAAEHGAEGTRQIAGKTFRLVEPGSMSLDEYDHMVADLTNFMTYAAEPIRTKRVALGWKVMIFLFIFFIVAWMLNKEFWKDVH